MNEPLDIYDYDIEPYGDCHYCGRTAILERDEYGQLCCEHCKEDEDELASD